MSFLLDTNVCVAFLDGTSAAVRNRLRGTNRDDVRLCSVVKAELLYGARNSARVDDNLRTLERFFAQFPSVPFDDAAAERYSVIRAQLRKLGTPVGANDMMIAAIAMCEDLTLVTRNQDEFRRIPALRVEAW